jgi:tetratricopeptide (TPR) repeat protein
MRRSIVGTTLGCAAVLYYLRRQACLTQTHAEAAIETGREFPQQEARAMPLQGWALAAMGQKEAGIARIQEGMTASRATGATRNRPEELALLAEVFAQVGQIAEGLEALAEALATFDQSEARLWEAELYRLRGELLLRQMVEQAEEAEICFQQALAVASRRQAKSLELPRRDAPESAVAASGEACRSPRTAGPDLQLVHRGLRHRRPAGG